MTAPLDRSPRGPDFDYIRPAERVPHIPQPRPTVSVPPLASAIVIGLGLFFLFLYALPDLLEWFRTWGIFQ